MFWGLFPFLVLDVIYVIWKWPEWKLIRTFRKELRDHGRK
jgi:hypothetical protein